MKIPNIKALVEPQKNPDGLTLLRTLHGHTDIVYGIAFSPDGHKIASSSKDNTIKIWETDSGKNSASLKGNTNNVTSVAFSPDGKKIAAGSTAHTINIWETDSGKKSATLRGHEHSVYSVCFSPDGKSIDSGSFDKTIKIWDVGAGATLATLKEQQGWIYSVAFNPDGKEIASAGNDNKIHLWNIQTNKPLRVLEGHTSVISSCIFTNDGQLLISRSQNDIRFWRTDTWQTVAIIDEPGADNWPPEIAFHPTKPILAVYGEEGKAIRLWELDYEILLDKEVIEASVPYTTAKIVLVGDSGVGKTGLGWRLAHNAYKEHSSTHGQQFWVIDELGQKRDDGTQCEAVLWDLAGQQDYRLVHALFLKDVDLALILFDPGNRENPLAGVQYWLKQLCHNQKESMQTILIGARTDRGRPTMTQTELDEFCDYYQIAGGFLATSAKENEGIDPLLDKIKTLIPWQDMPTTITTLTFKRVKQFVLDLKEQTSLESVIKHPDELRHALEATDRDWQFNDDEMMTAVKHLENHGYVTICTSANGQQSILLFPDVLVNLVSSFVLAARANPQGLGVLDEKKLLAGEYQFSDLKHIEASEQEILTDYAAVLFMNQNICFRETTEGASQRSFMVFPSLINEKRPKTGGIVTVDDTSYVITGAVENVYASLVVLLGYTEHFTRRHQWQNQAQYELKAEQICGFPIKVRFSTFFL
ncbi:MAG: GTP-binding protein [Psychrosphaera sp.]|nr:GTP-binding protein [Psychrosphaera sp.]